METNQIIATILHALLVAAVAVFIKYLAPWLREKAKGEHQEAINRILDTLVEAAEQYYGEEGHTAKFDYVVRMALDKGIDPSHADIEAAVLRLHAAGMSWEDVHGTLEETDTTDTLITSTQDNTPLPGIL